MAKQSFILGAALEDISRQVASIKQESTLRQYFVEALNKFLGANGLDFAQVGPLFTLDATVINGKPDAAIGALMFEAKLPKPKGAGITAAVEQLRGYLDEGVVKGTRCRGIAYDGVKIALLNEDKRIVFEGSPVNGAPILESWLLLLAGTITDPTQMVARFGSASAIAQTCIRTFHKIFAENRKKVPFVDEVFEVWQALYGCAANLNAEAVKGIERAAKYIQLPVRGKKQAEEFVFALETYLSILLKLLVVRVAVEQKLIPHRSVREVLFDPKGTTHRRYRNLNAQIQHLRNVFEADTFVWFADAAEEDQSVQESISNLLMSLADLVDSIRLVHLRQDFLQVFYQEFFEPAARRALGEFYTNRALVRETLDSVGYDGSGDGCLIDISCGSGNFLVEAISRKLERAKSKSKKQRLTAVTTQIFGADIHPLAVAMARVNYLISIGDLILDTTRELVHARDGKTSAEEIWPRFVQEIGQETALKFEETLKAFLKAVIKLHNDGRDMRWLPLLRNVLSIENLCGKCQYVVGNPPWVRSHNIEDAFRKRINEDYHYCKTAGWERGCTLANIGRGFARQTDLCIPFVERSLELLQSGGKLGFVITSKIQQALYANALRRDLISARTILKIVDYSLYAVPLFVDAVNYPMIIAVENATPSRDSRVSLQIYNLAGEVLESTPLQSNLSALMDDPESPWLMAPEEVINVIRELQKGAMLGSDPGLRARMGIKPGSTADYVLLNIEQADRPGILLVENENGKRFRIEQELIFPLIRGEDVKSYSFRVKNWIIFPHDPETAEPLLKLPANAKAYFDEADRQSRLRSREDYDASDPVWTLFRVTPDKLRAKTVWPEISTRMAACAVPEDFDDKLLGRRKLIPLQTAYLIPNENADVLAAVLNSTIFRSQMYAFAERARGAYFRHFSWTVGLGFVPQSAFECFRSALKPKDAKLLKLSRLGQRRDSATSEIGEIDNLVSQLFGISKADQDQLSSYCLFIGGRQGGASLFPEESVTAE